MQLYCIRNTSTTIVDNIIPKALPHAVVLVSRLPNPKNITQMEILTYSPVKLMFILDAPMVELEYLKIPKQLEIDHKGLVLIFNGAIKLNAMKESEDKQIFYEQDIFAPYDLDARNFALMLMNINKTY